MSDLENPPQAPNPGIIFQQWLFSLKHYVRMCLFTSSPANLPYSPYTILLTLITYVGVGQFLLGERREFTSIVAQIGIEVCILYIISFLVLKLLKKPKRLTQTLSALIGVSLCVSIVSLLITSALPPAEDPEQINPMALQVNLLLLFWNLSVISLIFKRAFEIRTILAAIIAFNYFLIYEFLLLNIF
mgnify:CR=1 FL=1